MTKISNQYSLTNVLFADAVNGRVGIGTETPGNKLVISQPVSTTFGNAGTYIGLGGTENAFGQTVLLGFGYRGSSTSEYPAVMGYLATDNGGNQNGALVFGTRSVTTNTATTERMRITSSGNVGIGTSSPVFADGFGVQIHNVSGSSRLRFTNNSSGATATDGGEIAFAGSDFYIGNNEAANLVLYTSATERMRIASNGDITFAQSRILQTTASSGYLALYGNGGGVYFGGSVANQMFLSSSGNLGIGTTSPTNFTNQTSLSINGVGVSRLDMFVSGTRKGGLVSASDATYVEADTAIPLIFNTNGNERMRISSGGNVGIGTSSPNSRLQIGTMVAYTGSGYTFAMGNGTTDFLITVNAAQSGSSVTFYSSTDYLFNRSGPSSTGVISAYGFNNISDYRLKYDLESFDGLSLISQIKTYKYKMEETHETQYGVLAHEIQEVLPHLVVGVKDGDRMQSVDYQKIVPMLIKSVQEQQTQINELKALLNA